MTEFRVDEDRVLNLKESLSMEWLDTNGLGGYASSTILDCHTRKYHGFLVSKMIKPSGRFVLLSKVEDSIRSGDKEYFLTTHRYPDVFHPQGYKYQTAFSLDYSPCLTFRMGDIIIQKRIMMIQGEDRVLIRYSCETANDPLFLRIKPLIAFRDYHELSRENPSLNVRIRDLLNGFVIRPYDGMPELFVQTSRRKCFRPFPLWYRNVEYSIEAERGFDDHEDLYQPGVFEIPLRDGSDVFVSAALKEFKGRLKDKWSAEERRRKQDAMKDETIVEDIESKTGRETALKLVRAGRKFIIRDQKKKQAIVAGYHWFCEWGRDTLISLPGLTFCSGRPEKGIEILRKYAGFEKNGLMPNFISEDGTSKAYNSVDSALWYFWAVQQMLKYTDDLKTIKKDLWPVMKKIIENYMAGTEYKIFMNDNGLIHAGDKDTQLTWMDAKAGGKSVTPRSGYAVDINALWYNALAFANDLAEQFGETTFNVKKYIDRSRESFNETFWIESGRYLGDVFSNGKLDRAVRPNQILAVSLPYTPLEPSRWTGVIERVKEELLTPCGLRTLSPGDAAYRGRYEGNSSTRDMAYHQGTVWPWLVGHYGEACLKTAEDRAAAKDNLLDLISKFLDEHFMQAGIGFVSEVFDGDPPHHPGGCIAQAWSTAEIIRLMRILKDEPDR
jgi:predicted glycogen debranching enzyme